MWRQIHAEHSQPRGRVTTSEENMLQVLGLKFITEHSGMKRVTHTHKKYTFLFNNGIFRQSVGIANASSIISGEQLFPATMCPGCSPFPPRVMCANVPCFYLCPLPPGAKHGFAAKYFALSNNLENALSVKANEMSLSRLCRFMGEYIIFKFGTCYICL